MSKIIEKRDSLENFIKEQVLGPGVNGYRYIDLLDSQLTVKDLKKERPINYNSEILDIVPAAIYSTGILFPEDATDTSFVGQTMDNNEQIEKKDDSEEDDLQNRSEDDIETNDSVELNQMFPRTMGLTCCLEDEFLKTGTIEIEVRARYYKKKKRDREGVFNDRYGLYCEVAQETIQNFLTQHNLSQFHIRNIEENTFLLLAHLKSEDLSLLKSRIKDIQKHYAEMFYDQAVQIVSFSHLRRPACYLSNLKSTIYYELKNAVIDKTPRVGLYNITQEIELIENICDHLNNLLDINTNTLGLWQSQIIEKTIKIEGIELLSNQKKKSYLYNKPNKNGEVITITDKNGSTSKGLRDIFKYKLDDEIEDYASLSANIQLSRDSRQRDSKVFLKVQLVNTSVPFDEAKQDDNRYYSTFNELVNQKAFFGVKLSITSEHLIPYSNYTYRSQDENYDEDTTTRFIYDQFKDYGVGHGCSVKWEINEAKRKIESEYLPSCETPDVDPIPRDKSETATYNQSKKFYQDPLFLESSKSQEFKYLSLFSDASDLAIVEGLRDFVDAYGKWIKGKREIERYKGQFREIATQELDLCEADYLRMKGNITNFLSGEENKENLKAFRLMNSAMFMQLWHSVKVKQDEVVQYMDSESFSWFNFNFYKNEADDKLFSKSDSASWRAFQLAFILLNLDGVFKAQSDDLWDKRNNWVDLVWFPTGGGKTEAYLGLIALTVINRRMLYGQAGGGTAAIMRYTLRLLTMQQFQRATLVIMALELIRRWGIYDLGIEPISIGLWVGKDSIPNSNKDLIYEFQHKLNKSKANRIPFNSCPWCNSGIKGEEKEDIDSKTSVYDQNKVHLKCTNNKCSFSFGIGRITRKRSDQGPIPVCLSDETIYQHPPSLLFGTVDKFAQLAHKISDSGKARNADSRRIFGRGNWEDGKLEAGYIPPDLIIQDELHLLLGPLGSAVALFESAIDQLCTRRDGTRPKIISSTATTRNTSLQIAALFDRKVNLFPKPGVECDDSFFAFYKRKYSSQTKEDQEFISKRKYIGILPTGRTQIWMQMRLAAIILTHRAKYELEQLGLNTPMDYDAYNSFKNAMDYYHSTISYFNSLREVGKTQSQVQTYILKELRRVFSRVIRPQKLMQSIYTYGPLIESELTGRLSGEQVKNELKNVERSWNAAKRFAHLEEVVENNTITRKVRSGFVPSEFVIATNMISVGIDVSRFNTILMNSMPRNIAEYIQASSRVARNEAGLVLTVHHPFRARDISHYEKFIEFHEKMYSYVEPISITPFTLKAVERYLGLYLATIIRHTNDRFTDRDSADEISDINDEDILSLVDSLMGYFQDRKDRLTQHDLLIRNLLKEENIANIRTWIEEAIFDWKNESNNTLADDKAFVFNNKSTRSGRQQEQLYVDIEEYDGNIHSKKWQIPMSLRVIEPEAAIKIISQ